MRATEVMYQIFPPQVACVVHAGFIDGAENVMYLAMPSGCTVARDQLKASFLLGENFIELLFNFSIRFNAFNLTHDELALFSALMLMMPGRWRHCCNGSSVSLAVSTFVRAIVASFVSNQRLLCCKTIKKRPSVNCCIHIGLIR